MRLLKSKATYITTMAMAFASFGLLFVGNASAKTISTNDIAERSYVIGEHLFTRDTNPDAGYNGYINTQMIMLAAKSIPGHALEDMNVYYKKADGSWVDGLTNRALPNAPEGFEIEYKNLDPYIPETTYSIGYYGAGTPQVESGYSVVAYTLTLQNLSDFKNSDNILKVNGFEQLVLAEDAEDWANIIGDHEESCQTIINNTRYCHIASRVGGVDGEVVAIFPVGRTYHIMTRAYETAGTRTVYGEPSASTLTVPNYYRVDFSQYPGDLTTGFAPAGEAYQFNVDGRYGYTYNGLAIARECTDEEKAAAGIPSSDSALCPSDVDFNPDTVITSDIKVAAKWTAHIYNVEVRPTDAVGAIMGMAAVYDDGSVLVDNYAIYLEDTSILLFDSVNPSIALSELNGISTVKIVITHNDGVFTTTANLTLIPYGS